MQRIRAIIPQDNKGIFYNIDDIFSILGINKDIFFSSIYNFVKSCRNVGVIKPQKFLDKYCYKENIKGANGTQEHIYCHKQFFEYFCTSDDLISIRKLLNGED